ncbi:hypothetical protein MIND_01101000 [Mycena indigotica]|uniref:Uncharacterized protein n=1 Tax=Mycena indigotica TaxID=2126181 RepID=A0A8H6SA22_9AGAR|nr:uncharacterized protein MIND_01101000 [Mycena indigotica]KAF7295609.1 hypothetical protein MIND_01101000 [Mycena indigotica]
MSRASRFRTGRAPRDIDVDTGQHVPGHQEVAARAVYISEGSGGTRLTKRPTLTNISLQLPAVAPSELQDQFASWKPMPHDTFDPASAMSHVPPDNSEEGNIEEGSTGQKRKRSTPCRNGDLCCLCIWTKYSDSKGSATPLRIPVVPTVKRKCTPMTRHRLGCFAVRSVGSICSARSVVWLGINQCLCTSLRNGTALSMSLFSCPSSASFTSSGMVDFLVLFLRTTPIRLLLSTFQEYALSRSVIVAATALWISSIASNYFETPGIQLQSPPRLHAPPSGLCDFLGFSTLSVT